MIVFDLRCDGGHVFEAWFASSGAYDDQRRRGLVACPICGDTAIGKAVMAPAVAPKCNTLSSKPVPAAPKPSAPALPASAPPEVKAAFAALAAAQASALKDSTWVGRNFAREARAMHEGDKPHATIHGQATPAEARALAEDGVAVAPLLVPVAPPEQQN